MSDEIEVFLAKVETFAEGLNAREQAMLAFMVSDDPDGDDVAGFSMYEAWPKEIHDVAPLKIGKLRTDFDGFLSSGHGGYVISREVTKDEI